MSTKHAKAAEKFLENLVMAAWHNETLWMVRAKRDKMSKEVPEWEDLREKACELKLYSNSHLDELLVEFEKNATANGAIVHWRKMPMNTVLLFMRFLIVMGYTVL